MDSLHGSGVLRRWVRKPRKVDLREFVESEVTDDAKRACRASRLPLVLPCHCRARCEAREPMRHHSLCRHAKTGYLKSEVSDLRYPNERNWTWPSCYVSILPACLAYQFSGRKLDRRVKFGNDAVGLEPRFLIPSKTKRGR
jgi:hypothetical protein